MCDCFQLVLRKKIYKVLYYWIPILYVSVETVHWLGRARKAFDIRLWLITNELNNEMCIHWPGMPVDLE